MEDREPYITGGNKMIAPKSKYEEETRTRYSGPDTTYTVTASPPCKHKNGWYGRVEFWVFHRMIYACSDCGEMIYGKKLREYEENKVDNGGK